MKRAEEVKKKPFMKLTNDNIIFVTKIIGDIIHGCHVRDPDLKEQKWHETQINMSWNKPGDDSLHISTEVIQYKKGVVHDLGDREVYVMHQRINNWINL